MTYKSIIENMVEREARQALLKELNLESWKLDFGKVEMQNKDSNFQDFAVDIKELAMPWTEYRVIGFISDLGFITLSHWRYVDNPYVDNPTEWHKLPA